MTDYGPGLRAVLRLLPSEYRHSHADEIVTTLRDAQDNGPLRVHTRDLVSLAAAAVRIRARSYAEADWRPEIDRGIVLGIRAYMLFLAIGTTTFLWTTAVMGASIYGGYGYSEGTRVHFVIILLPLIAAFALQLYGRWRTAVGLAILSNVLSLVLVASKITTSEFGVGYGTLAAVAMSAITVVLALVGMRLGASAVRWPLLALGAWATASAVLGTMGSGFPWTIGGQVVAVGGGLALVAIGMAIAGRPHGLVAWAVLILPGWLMSDGLLYWGNWKAWYLQFAVGVAVFVLMAGLVVAGAVRLTRRGQRMTTD